MADAVAMRPVPSGQMYRQMFDAEVQLVQSLATSKAAQREKSYNRDTRAREATGIPIVRNAMPALSERQKTWATSMPNDWKTENPVLRRHNTLANKRSVLSMITSEEEDQVSALPDLVSVVSRDSSHTQDLIARLGDGRRERHEAAVDDMEHELSHIAKTVDEELVRRTQETNDFLERQQDEIDRIMLTAQSQSSTMDNEQLVVIWDAVSKICEHRQASIARLEGDLSEIEARRRKYVFDCLRKYFKIIERIAHLLPVETRRLFEKEAQTMNEVLMDNNVELVEVTSLLNKHEIELERELRNTWQERRADWANTCLLQHVNSFDNYITSSEVNDPQSVKVILEEFYTREEQLNQRRLDLINGLKDGFQPPKSQKSAAYQWHVNIKDTSKQLLALQEQYLTRIHAEYERICQTCLDRLDEVKAELIATKVCDEQTVKTAIESHFLPLIGKQQNKFENYLQNMDTELEEQNLAQAEEVKSLFKFCQGLAHIWDQHEAGLAAQERAMQENLAANRARNDALNQEREANLDLAIDKMRQETSESGLKNTLKHVLEVLDRIQAGYDQFFQEQEKIVKKYPTSVHQEVQSYDENLCRYFGVARKGALEDSKASSRRGTGATSRATPTQGPGAAGGAQTARPVSKTPTPGHHPSTAREALGGDVTPKPPTGPKVR